MPDMISCRRMALFGHIAQMDISTPAHGVLDCVIVHRNKRHPARRLEITPWETAMLMDPADRKRIRLRNSTQMLHCTKAWTLLL